MDIRRCFLTQNPCYAAAQSMIPKGIVVHSTGANNKWLKRYVQPTKGQFGYDDIIKDIGLNKNGNSWNRSGKQACVHAFIGLNASDHIRTYQTLPWNWCAWGVGKGKRGSYNFDPPYLQFEICEDALNDAAYFDQAIGAAIDLCAYLCDLFGLKTETVVSHHEAYLAGYGCNHADIDHWLVKFGWTMDMFRSAVADRRDKEYTVWCYRVKSDAIARERASALRAAGFPAYIEEKRK